MHIKNLMGLMALLLVSYNADAIRNGKSTIIPDNVVTLKINNKSYCTGLRISQNYIVTVAHCITGGKILITYADNGKKKTYRTHSKNAKIKSKKMSAEIAILKINSKNTGFIGPVISTESSEIYLNDYKFFGYGYNHKGSIGKLRYGFLDSLGTYNSNGYTMLTMQPGSSNQQPCPGDSGGPLFTNDGKAIAVVSFVNSSSESIGSYSPKKQCQKANRSYFVYLKEHMDFLKPYL